MESKKQEYYDINEFSMKTGVSRSTIYKHVVGGKIKAKRGVKGGRLDTWLIPVTELDRYKN